MLVLAVIVVGTPALSPAGAAPAAAPPAAGPTAGLVSGGAVVAGGIVLSSGGWGTDYITVSHALRVGGTYAILQDGLPFAEAAPVAACSSHSHGIDVLILRVKTHTHRPAPDWGDPAELRAGDELVVYPRREFHPEPVRVKFIHGHLLTWLNARPDQWPAPWHNVMVADGYSRPGFSGSPWVRDGKVYGLLKGTVRPPGQATWYVAGESATRIRQCLTQVHYDDLVPKE
jgi:hypothetical protein